MAWVCQDLTALMVTVKEPDDKLNRWQQHGSLYTALGTRLLSFMSSLCIARFVMAFQATTLVFMKTEAESGQAL